MLVVHPPKLNSKSMKSFEMAGVATAGLAGEEDATGADSSAAASRLNEGRQPYVEDDTGAGAAGRTAEVMAGGEVGASTGGITRSSKRSVSRSQSRSG
jgi:hypothetical protein